MATPPPRTTTPTMTPAIIPAFESLGSVDEVLDDEGPVKETKC